jgi:hypothetical protein
MSSGIVHPMSVRHGHVRHSDPIILKVPLLPHFEAVALFGCIILTTNHRLVPHELIHIEQQRKIGRLKYHWLWLVSPNFRARMEIEAYARADGYTNPQIKHILAKKYGLDLDLGQIEAIRASL